MDIKMLQTTGLFQGMSKEEVFLALTALEAAEKSFRKGETILHAGSVTQSLGLVLSGSVTIENNDLWGNRTILSHAESGQFLRKPMRFWKRNHCWWMWSPRKTAGFSSSGSAASASFGTAATPGL